MKVRLIPISFDELGGNGPGYARKTMELQARGGVDVECELHWLRDAVRESYGPLGRYLSTTVVLP